MTPRLSDLIADCQRTLELRREATSGDWMPLGESSIVASAQSLTHAKTHGPRKEPDRLFICHNATFAPIAAKAIIDSTEREARQVSALKVAKDALKQQRSEWLNEMARARLLNAGPIQRENIQTQMEVCATALATIERELQ